MSPIMSTMRIDNHEILYIDLFSKRNFIRKTREDWKDGSISIAAAYVAKGGSKFWKQFSARGTLDQACREALAVLRLESDWISGVKVGLVVDCGPGTGEKTAMWLLEIMERGHRPNVALVDISKSMVHAACRPVVALAEKRGPFAVAAVRAEFNQLTDFRSLLPIRYANNCETAVYLLLGQTFGNLPPGDAVGFFERNMRMGDLAVIGLEFSRTLDGTRCDLEKTRSYYNSSETQSIWKRAASVVTTGGIILPPEIVRKLGEDSFSVVGFHLDDKTKIKTEVFRSTRYTEAQVRRMFADAGFELIASALAPRHPTYRLLVFRKVR